MTTPMVLIATLAAIALAHPLAVSAAPDPSPAGSGRPVAAPESPVSPAAAIAINRASQGQLETLPGIGPRKAAALVSAREERPFRRPSDLRRVKGFGSKTIRRLAPLLSFD